MRAKHAICIHVRRGDYLSNPVAAEVHGTCSVDYYLEGVRSFAMDWQGPIVCLFR